MEATKEKRTNIPGFTNSPTKQTLTTKQSKEVCLQTQANTNCRGKKTNLVKKYADGSRIFIFSDLRPYGSGGAPKFSDPKTQSLQLNICENLSKLGD